MNQESHENSYLLGENVGTQMKRKVGSCQRNDPHTYLNLAIRWVVPVVLSIAFLQSVAYGGDGEFTLKQLHLGMTQQEFLDLFPPESKPEGAGRFDVSQCTASSFKGVRTKQYYDGFCSYAPWVSIPFKGSVPAAPEPMLTFLGRRVSGWEMDIIDGKAAAISVLMTYSRAVDEVVQRKEFSEVIAAINERFGPPFDKPYPNMWRWRDAQGNVMAVAGFDPWDPTPQRNMHMRVRVESKDFLDLQTNMPSKERQEKAKHAAKDM